jgi:hypothetical protein
MLPKPYATDGQAFGIQIQAHLWQGAENPVQAADKRRSTRIAHLLSISVLLAFIDGQSFSATC